MKESCTNMYITANNLKKALFVIVLIKMTSFSAGLPSFLIDGEGVSYHSVNCENIGKHF